MGQEKYSRKNRRAYLEKEITKHEKIRDDAKKRMYEAEKHLKQIQDNMENIISEYFGKLCKNVETIFREIVHYKSMSPEMRTVISNTLDKKPEMRRVDYEFALYNLIGIEMADHLKPACLEKGEAEFWGGLQECEDKAYRSCPCGYLDAFSTVHTLIDAKDHFEDTKLKGLQDDEGLRRRGKLKHKIRTCRAEINQTYENIRDAKQSMEDRRADIEKTRETFPYRKDFEDAYELADKLFDYVKEDEEARLKLGVMVPPRDSEGLRTLRKALLDYCRDNNVSPAAFCRPFYGRQLSDQFVVSGLACAIEGGFCKHQEINGVKAAIEKEKDGIREYEKHIVELNERVANTYSELNLRMSAQT